MEQLLPVISGYLSLTEKEHIFLSFPTTVFTPGGWQYYYNMARNGHPIMIVDNLKEKQNDSK